jgi:hypothetical protein
MARSLLVFNPGEVFGTMSAEGVLSVWRVSDDGQLQEEPRDVPPT